MMRLKHLIRKYFGFSKNETNGTIILFFIVIVLILLPNIFEYYFDTNQKVSKEKEYKLCDLHSNSNYTENNLVDINQASFKELKKKFNDFNNEQVNRIIKFRNKLGGFISKYQFNEIYGLKKTHLSELNSKSYILKKFTPLKINLNKDKFKVMLRHPYLSYEEVIAILNFRIKKGYFSSVEELLKNNLINKSKYKKLKPYLQT